MEAVRDWDAYQRFVVAVPREAGSYITNLYASREEVEHWCAANQLHAIFANGAILFLRADRDFFHIYHVAKDLAALAAAIHLLTGATFVVDIVEHGAQLSKVCDIYAANGFVLRKSLQRMSCFKTPGEVSEGEVEVASPEEAPAVAEMLGRLLDRYVEQIPDVEELRREAQREKLLIVRRDTTIAGILLYGVKGRLAHLRLWHVDDNARGQGVGRLLMQSFLARCAAVQRILLWVISDNERSVAIYRHYGFTPDGLFDHILIRAAES